MYILVVDDSSSDALLVQKALSRENHEVDAAHGALEAMIMIKRREPDLLILDIRMPGMDGFEFSRTLRAEGYETPLIFLTGQDSIEMIRRGLSIGAYDYICKPFSLQGFVARIKEAIYRIENDILRCGCVRLYLKTRKVIVSGQKAIRLTSREELVLGILMKHANQYVSRDHLLKEVWNDNGRKNLTNVVDVYICRLRAKLEADPHNPQYIIGARRLGYRFSEK